MKILFSIGVLSLIVLCVAHPAIAHVPYIEKQDFSEEHPFIVHDSIENSKAIYAWFDTGTDVDVYTFEVNAPVMVYAQAIVIACPSLEGLLPRFAVVGPGLPVPDEDLPFELPDGYGAVVVQNKKPGEPRDTFFEPFSAKTYFDGPEFNQEVTIPGLWYIYYWDPYKIGGDYVAVLGSKESFSLLNTLRSLINTPKIWFNLELHTKCR
jgi:hypothetical protein